jgi:phosphoribosylformimino-5-aminoimidazole carboxamide ribotide isomerase
MKFRPCIDLRGGKVVQIVGGTLADEAPDSVATNFQTDAAPADFARRYRDDDLPGGHVIALGPGNEDAALAALSAWPGGLHYGGGVNADNASRYLKAGASHVIVTSWIFRDGQLDDARLQTLVKAVGAERLVLDLSCRRRGDNYYVVTDRWQNFTGLAVTRDVLARLSESCSEFLVHGVDVEGLKAGIEEDLVSILAEACERPVTYAGGVRNLDDMARIDKLGSGRIDATIGSALDIFGGTLAYADVLAWHKAQ